MTPLQAIQAATLEAARLLSREAEIGNIAEGHYADLIAVQGNPLDDIRLLENVAHVIKGGAVIK